MRRLHPCQTTPKFMYVVYRRQCLLEPLLTQSSPATSTQSRTSNFASPCPSRSRSRSSKLSQSKISRHRANLPLAMRRYVPECLVLSSPFDSDSMMQLHNVFMRVNVSSLSSTVEPIGDAHAIQLGPGDPEKDRQN